jgi:hypothetical protein
MILVSDGGIDAASKLTAVAVIFNQETTLESFLTPV